MENSNSSAPENSGTGTTGAPLVEQVKQQTQQVAQQAGEKAGQVVEQVRDQVKSQLSERKEQAAGGLGTVAQALRQTGETLRTEEQAGVAQAADSAAQLVDQISGYLRDRDIDDLVGEVENFARTNPAVFLGSAFVLGFMAARFLKSSAPSPASAGGGYNGGDYGTGGTSAYESYDALVPTTAEPVTARSGSDLDLIPDQFGGTSGGGGAAVGLGASGSLGTSSALDTDTDAGLGTGLGTGTSPDVGTGLGTGTDLGTGTGLSADADLGTDTDVDTDADRLITRSDDR